MIVFRFICGIGLGAEIVLGYGTIAEVRASRPPGTLDGASFDHIEHGSFGFDPAQLGADSDIRLAYHVRDPRRGRSGHPVAEKSAARVPALARSSRSNRGSGQGRRAYRGRGAATSMALCGGMEPTPPVVPESIWQKALIRPLVLDGPLCGWSCSRRFMASCPGFRRFLLRAGHPDQSKVLGESRSDVAPEHRQALSSGSLPSLSRVGRRLAIIGGYPRCGGNGHPVRSGHLASRGDVRRVYDLRSDLLSLLCDRAVYLPELFPTFVRMRCQRGLRQDRAEAERQRPSRSASCFSTPTGVSLASYR